MYILQAIIEGLTAALDYIVTLWKHDRVALIIGAVLGCIGYLLSLGTLFWVGLLAFIAVLIIAERSGHALDIEKDFMRAVAKFKKADTLSQAQPGTATINNNSSIQSIDPTSMQDEPKQVRPITIDEDKVPITEMTPLPELPKPLLVPVKPISELTDSKTEEDKPLTTPITPPETELPQDDNQFKYTKKSEMPKPIRKGVGFIGEFLSSEQKQSASVLDIGAVEAAMKAKIKGQDHAVDIVINTLKRVAAGIRTKPESPLSVFLFLGPTGTGKTEIVKQLALATGRPLLRYDMPNYNSEHTIWSLIGSPTGYIGSEKAGALTGAIQSQPDAILLLDEVEKAHKAIFDPLLRVLDEGRLTDQSKGFTANFKNVIIFLTSNLMAFEEFSDQETTLRNKLLNDGYFRPELVNRIDRIVMFKHLTPDVLSGLVANLVVSFAERFAASNKINADIKIDRNLIEHIIKNVDTKFGARDAERFVEREIGDAVAEAYLKVVGQATPIQEIKIFVNNENNVEVLIK